MNKYNQDKFNEVLKEEVKDINIDIPEELKRRVLKTLDNLPDRKIKRKSKLRRISQIAVGFIICILSFNLIMPTYAESLPIIGPTFKSINEAIGIGDKYVEGSKDINITKKYKDTTMTIKNIYYDGVELAIAYELKCEKGFDDKPIIFPIIKSGFKDIDYKNEENDGEFIDDNTYVGLASYAFTDNQLSDKDKIEFVVNDLYGNWVGYYPKKFKFKFSIDSKDMGKETYNVDKEIEYGNSKYKVTKLITSKLNTIIYINTDTEVISDGKYRMRFFIVDDKGVPIKAKNGSFTSSKENDKRVNGNGYWRFEGVKDEAKSITLIPTINPEIYSNDKAFRFEKINKDTETIMKLDTGEEYIIKNIDFQEDKTIIDIKMKKYLSGLDYLPISIWDEGKVQKYKDSNNGQEDNWYKDTIDIEILDTKFNGVDDGYNFTLTLPALDKNKEYYIPIMDFGSKILEDEKITIDLEK